MSGLLEQRFRLDSLAIGLLLSLTGASQLLSARLLPRLLRRMSERELLLVGGGLMGLPTWSAPGLLASPGWAFPAHWSALASPKPARPRHSPVVAARRSRCLRSRSFRAALWAAWPSVPCSSEWATRRRSVPLACCCSHLPGSPWLRWGMSACSRPIEPQRGSHVSSAIEPTSSADTGPMRTGTARSAISVAASASSPAVVKPATSGSTVPS